MARPGSELPATHWDGAPERVFVLLHAGVCDRRSWAEVAPLLTPAGSVLAYDRRGFGDAAVPDAPFSHLDDLRAVIDAVRAEAPQRPVWLVGSSKGGGLALEAAAARAPGVAGVVAQAPGLSGAPDPGPAGPGDHSDDFDDEYEAAVAAGDREEMNRIDTRFWLDGPNSPEGRVGGQARDLALAMGAITIRNDASQELERERPPAWEAAAGIAVPVTIAAGDLDAPGLVAVSRQLAGRIPGARWADLPGTAHLPYLEDPRAFAGLVLAAVRD